jgi:hypothetical protein
LHLRGVSPEIERLAKMEAARLGKSLSEFVSDAIQRAARASESESERRLAPLTAERAWYETHRDEVAREYAGKIVAIANGGVIVAGDALIDVAREVRARIGDQPAYVVNLAKQPKPKLAPSPARGAA